MFFPPGIPRNKTNLNYFLYPAVIQHPTPFAATHSVLLSVIFYCLSVFFRFLTSVLLLHTCFHELTLLSTCLPVQKILKHPAIRHFCSILLLPSHRATLTFLSYTFMLSPRLDLTLDFSSSLVIMIMLAVCCSQTILQKSPKVSGREPWVAM